MNFQMSRKDSNKSNFHSRRNWEKTEYEEFLLTCSSEYFLLLSPFYKLKA
jgi:hypothetical protein